MKINKTYIDILSISNVQYSTVQYVFSYIFSFIQQHSQFLTGWQDSKISYNALPGPAA